MKRLLIGFLCLALLFSLTACSSLSALLEHLPMFSGGTEPTGSTLGTEGTEPHATGSSEPPVTEPPVTQPEPPVVTPPVEDPPEDDPPAEDPPVVTPPVEDPPEDDPPAEDTPVVTPPLPDPTAPGVTAEHLRRIEEGFLMLVNLERQSCGVGTLSIDPYLDAAAQLRSVEIVELFSHERPNGEGCFTAIDTTLYPAATLGENICFTSHVGTGYYTQNDVWVGSDAQIEATYGWIFTLFKNSPGHYANMINASFEDCGIGVTCRMDEHGIPYFYVGHFFGAKFS